jgi:hypothetical protein
VHVQPMLQREGDTVRRAFSPASLRGGTHAGSNIQGMWAGYRAPTRPARTNGHGLPSPRRTRGLPRPVALIGRSRPGQPATVLDALACFSWRLLTVTPDIALCFRAWGARITSPELV